MTDPEEPKATPPISHHLTDLWRRDAWKDDPRQQIVRNPAGSGDPEATLKATLEHAGLDATILLAQERG